MHRFGVILVWTSLIAAVSGLIFGFIDFVKYGEPSFWIALVPAAFAGLLMGIVMTLFSNK